MKIKIWWFFKIVFCLHIAMSMADEFKLGIENISPSLIEQLKNYRIALLTNKTGKNKQGLATHKVLQNHGIALKKILVPEHGFDANKKASQEIIDQYMEEDIPLISLYGKGTGKKITDEQLGDVDIILVDLQDCGMRHYTYISTMYYVLQAAAEFNKKILVFDRPNPLGSLLEGPLVEQSLISFISIAPIPLRHAMTIGELAHFFNHKILEKKAQLLIIPMANYDRSMRYPLQERLELSPNIQSLNACFGYSFLGLLGEIRPFNLGIGTRYAFQGIYLPENKHKVYQWKLLRENLLKEGIKCNFHRYQHKNKMYAGLKFTINHMEAISSWSAFCTIIDHFKQVSLEMRCSESFDKAAGTAFLRNLIESSSKISAFKKVFEPDLLLFTHKARESYFYLPHPRVL